MFPKSISILFALLFWVTGRGQNNVINQVDRYITADYKNMMSADESVRCDSLAGIFKKKLSESLLNPITLKNTLDSLSEYITIKGSEDGKVKFYSWDNECGGTWHTINSLVQFIKGKGDIGVQKLSTGNEMRDGGYSDCSYYEVHLVSINNSKIYITFSWGTHGEGMEFVRIQAFKIVDNQFKECKSCIENKKDLVLEYKRGVKLNLRFNATSNEITYNEFSKDEDQKFPQFTGKLITLKLNETGFYKKQ
jgi:hypothetical protein